MSAQPSDFIATFKLGCRVSCRLDAQMTLRQVAKEIGVSWQRVWQIERIALGKVAKQLQARGWHE